VGYLYSHSPYFASRFYQRKENQPNCACRPMHSTWVEFVVKLSVKNPISQQLIRAVSLRGEVQQAVVESLEVVLPKEFRVDPFVQVQSTLHWRACHTVGDSRFVIEEGTEHEHTFSGLARLGLLAMPIPSDSVWVPRKKLFLAIIVRFDSENFYVKELKREMERIPKNLYRKLVEHQPDDRLSDFPWLSTAYRIAEYLLAQNELTREQLIPIVQQSCKTRNAKFTLACACNIWSTIANNALIQEVNYQLFMLQIVSRWPNFRLYYRIIPRNGQANEAQEGWILPQQLQCFACATEPFWSLIELLMKYGPERMIELHPLENGLHPLGEEKHYRVCRWLLQYCGKLNEYNGSTLFYIRSHVAERVQLTFYL